MTNKEINELADWTAKSIQRAVKDGGRVLDDEGTDIVREYVQKFLLKWERGEKITHENISKLVEEIFMRRREETNNADEVMNALVLLGAKFPSFVAQMQRERDMEAARIAATLPAVKV